LKALETRLAKLERRAIGGRAPLCVLRRIVSPDGSHNGIVERGPDGTWRPASEPEPANADPHSLVVILGGVWSCSA
jgi:hypothetical protein